MTKAQKRYPLEMARTQEPTLTDTLASHGYTHRRAANGLTTGKHDVFDTNGSLVASLTAFEAWDWIKAHD